jgi:hypothetical protein
MTSANFSATFLSALLGFIAMRISLFRDSQIMVFFVVVVVFFSFYCYTCGCPKRSICVFSVKKQS